MNRKLLKCRIYLIPLLTHLSRISALLAFGGKKRFMDYLFFIDLVSQYPMTGNIALLFK